MRVHLLLVGVYGPSSSCMHFGFFKPPVGSAAPRVEGPSG